MIKGFFIIVGVLAVLIGVVYVTNTTGTDDVIVYQVDETAAVVGEVAKEKAIEATNAGIEASRVGLDKLEDTVNVDEDFE